jgi:uncharacterized membrane-anchored protein YjiN (DUF445 family)
MVTDAVNTLLDEVTQDRSHQIRQAFDRATLKLIDNLKTDPLLAEKAENIKAYLKNDETLTAISARYGPTCGRGSKRCHPRRLAIQQRIADAGSGLVKRCSTTTRCASR